MSHSTAPDGEPIENVLILEPDTVKMEIGPYFADGGSDQDNSTIFLPVRREVQTNIAWLDWNIRPPKTPTVAGNENGALILTTVSGAEKQYPADKNTTSAAESLRP